MINGPFYTYRRIYFTRGIVRKCFVYMIFVCNYLGGPRIAAATWPSTSLFFPRHFLFPSVRPPALQYKEALPYGFTACPRAKLCRYCYTNYAYSSAVSVTLALVVDDRYNQTKFN